MHAAKVKNTIISIIPTDPALVAEAMAHIDSLTKPVGSLGRLEELAAKLFAIQGGEKQDGEKPLCVDPARIITAAGDHGVCEEGVSSSPSVVTRQQIYNFLNGGGGISVLCACNGIQHLVADIGVAGEEFADHPLLARRRVANGTANMSKGPAMTKEECLAAVAAGITLAEEAAAQNVRCLGTGEMGIGNTTPSTALFAALYGFAPEDIVGPGAGVPPAGMQGKIDVIKKSLRVNEAGIADGDPLHILAALGGLEIAALTGLILGGAANRIPVVIDGFISTAAYAVAHACNEHVKDYCFFAHASAEPGHRHIMERIGERPLVDLDFRLGEGTGAVFGMVILRNAAAIFNTMATFTSAGVSGSV
ncbi:MAG: Nicotinate-nucleotide--dimethylbenzimidazole phosphoribosyltransferase [Desulfovibrio sp.]